MGRKAHADFLSTYIEARVKASDKSLTIALDADWGAGKTFFVTNWADDLKQLDRGVMVFDAWKNDSASDPVLGFMAELQQGMQLLRKKVPLTKKAAADLKQAAASMYKAVRKAIVPAANAVAAGALKKATGIVISEVAEAVQADDFELDIDAESLGSDATKQLEKSLDVFFKKALEDHRARGKATETFRKSLERLVVQLIEAGVMQGPLYVFVDELDRCRPDYAIRLLEGIKHLFAVPGVVFVISTNLEQLGKSVQAIYGASFDGTSYLKRFFDFESSLPPPDNLSFAKMLVNGPAGSFRHTVDYGIGQQVQDHNDNVAKAFQLIADAFNLPLRTQERVYVMAAAAAAGVPARDSIAILWLFFLVALRQTRISEFKDVSTYQLDATSFESMIKRIGRLSGIKIGVSRGFGRIQNGPQEVSLSKVIRTYYEFTLQSLGYLRNVYNRSNDPEYPESLLEFHIGSSFSMPHDETRLGLASYYNLVNSAGYLRV